MAKTPIILAILCGISSCFAADLIPTNRLVPWAPNVDVGVVGGIPTDRTHLIDVTQAPYNADRTGTSDTHGAIQNAIDASASGDIVYLPAGTYRLDSSIGLKSNMTLRGAGAATILDLQGNSAVEMNGIYGSFYDDAAGRPRVSAGLGKGSSTITIPDTSEYPPGTELKIIAKNNPGQFDSPVTVHVSGYDWARQHKAIVTGRTATTLTFTPALYTDWSAIECRLMSGVPIVRSSVESLVMDATDATFVLRISDGSNCWLKDVRVKNSRHYTIAMFDSVNCEIRRCYLDDQNRGNGSNGGGFLCEANTGILFEDNYIGNSYPGIEVNFGTTGSVFAYNLFNMTDPITLAIDVNHGPHNEFNLWEGNIFANLQSDGYFGSCSTQTIFRNWVTGVTGGQPNYTVALKRFSRDFSLVGNIIGSPGYTWTNDGSVFGPPNIGNSDFSGDAPPWADWGTSPGPDGFQEFDHGVLATLVRVGNHSYYAGKIPDAEALGTAVLPDSLYRSSKPAFFGSLAWPPFDPRAPGSPAFTQIPAGYRYVHGTDPGTIPPTNHAPVASAQAVSVTKDTAKAITLSGSDADGDPLIYAIAANPAHGTLSGSGANRTYTPTTGYTGADSFTFTVNDGTVSSSAATVSITVSAPTNQAPVVSAATATPLPVTATTASLSATASDDGGEPALIYTWSSSGPAAVTFSQNGSNAAKASTATFAKAGIYTLTVTAKDAGNLIGTKSVAVTVNATPTALSISPTTASVQPGMKVDFNAVVVDQFARALTTQPTPTWTVSGGGTINANGLFTAGSGTPSPSGGITASTYVVTAAAGGISNMALVTVSTAAPSPTGGVSGCGTGGVAGLIAGLGLMLARRRRR